MPVAARKNTISEGESPISSVKYNEEIDNVYFSLNKAMSFFSGSSAPDEPMLNQYWLDTASNPAVLRRYDGAVWRWTGIHFGTTAPLNPISGAFFINSDAGTMAFWDGAASEWVSLPGTAIGFDPTGTDLASTNLEDALKEMYVSYLDTLAQAEIAVTAAGQASGYATAADEARAAAVVAQGLAEGAETGAVTAQGLAELAQGFAEDAQTDAEAAQGFAEEARDKARDWAKEDEDVEVEAGEYSAKHHALKSLAHSNDSRRWASESEDTLVSGTRYSSRHYAAKSATSASSSAVSAEEALSHRNAAEGFASNAQSAAEAVASGIVPEWDDAMAYSFPDMVVGPDGHMYRCMGDNVVSMPDVGSEDWMRVMIATVPQATFEYDSNMDLMPALPAFASFWWDIDEHGDIMPAI